MRFKKSLIAWFVVFGVLSIISQIPMVVLVAAIVSVGALGLLLVVSPTVLLYSVALLPAITIRRAHPALRIAAALLLPAAVGLLPGNLSRMQADTFAQRMGAEDVAKPASAKPKTIELIGDNWSYLFGADEGVVSCPDICRKLLYNHEVEQVRMTRVPIRNNFSKGAPAASVTYHLEKRDSCPALFEGDDIGKAIRDHLVAGNCLIATTETSQPLDTTASLILLYHSRYFPTPPELTPRATSIDMVRRLSIEQRSQTGAAVHLLQHTETDTRVMPVPFYFGYALNIGGGSQMGSRAISRAYTIKPIDLEQALRDTFGFKLAPVEPPPAEDIAKVAERVLTLSTTVAPVFSAQQRDAIKDALATLRRQADLGDSDIDFISRVILDERVNQGSLGNAVRDLFDRHRMRLVTVIPVLVQRLKFPVNERVGHYQAALGWTLMQFPAEALQPYRDAIIEIVEAEPDWHTAGPLSYITDLEGDPTDLIARRLEAKSDATRQAAAMAACRSTRAIWEKLRPVVIAHLQANVQGGRGFQDESRKLLVALARFGEQETAARLIDASNAFDKVRFGQQIAALGQGFPVKTCMTFM